MKHLEPPQHIWQILAQFITGVLKWLAQDPGPALGRVEQQRSWAVTLWGDLLWWFQVCWSMIHMMNCWNIEGCSDVSKFLCEWWNIYIYIDFRSLLNLQKGTSNRQMRIYLFILHRFWTKSGVMALPYSTFGAAGAWQMIRDIRAPTIRP